MIFHGFRLWYIRVQKPLDEKLRLENLLANQGVKKVVHSDDVDIDTKIKK